MVIYRYALSPNGDMIISPYLAYKNNNGEIVGGEIGEIYYCDPNDHELKKMNDEIINQGGCFCRFSKKLDLNEFIPLRRNRYIDNYVEDWDDLKLVGG